MTGSYLLELSRWNVKNDGTNAVTTSAGINNALSWAATEGFAELVLPNGVYLIDENNPIIPQSFLTLNLGGAILRIRDNSLPSYSIILLNNKQHVRIINGKVEGDRYTHNYDSGGTHEFGVGINLRFGSKNITIEDLEIYNTTGDGIIGLTSYGGIGGGFPQLPGNLEQGGINTTNGTLTPDTNRIRSSINIPMVPQITNLGYFGLYGDSYGGIGNEISTDTFDVIFYKSNNSFLSSITDLHFFDEIEVPTEASYAKVVLHQSTIPTPQGIRITIRTPEFPKHIYIEKCNIHHCRRLGVAICGMKQCYIRGCEIHHISGTSPAGAIDIEDGYDLNQYIYIDENNIYDNKAYNIIVIAGRHINITSNRIQQGIFTINSGADKVIVSDNHFHNSDPRLSGETIFSNNHIYNSRMRLLGTSEALVNNCKFHNSAINFDKQKAYVAQINNCKFLFDDDFYLASSNPGAPLIFSIEPQTISNSVFEGSGQEAFTVVPAGAYDWQLENVSFINIKHRSNRVTGLPPGTYNGCQFIHSGRLNSNPGPNFSKFEFNNCYFKWDSYPLFYIGSSIKVDTLIISNCYFYNPSTSDYAFYMNGNWGNILFSNNTFNYLNGSSSSMIEITRTASIESFALTSNTFLAKNMNAIKSDNSPTVKLFAKDNILFNTRLQLSNSHLRFDNIIDNIRYP